MTQATKETPSSAVPPSSLPATASPPPATPKETDDSSGFMRYLMYAALGLIFVILLPLIVGLVVVFANTNTSATAERFGMIRDVVMIILSLQGVLIIIALVVLIMQIARLVVMLQTEVSPILDDAKKTAQTAKGTAEFVGKNMTTPIIEAKAFSAGAFVFFRELGGIRRAIRKTRKAAPTPIPEQNHDE